MTSIYDDFITDVTGLVESIKEDISDDYQAFEFDDEPRIQLTVAINNESDIIDCDYAWQTGDNCYTGAAYSRRHWAVTGVYRNTSAYDAAHDLLEQLLHSNGYEGTTVTRCLVRDSIMYGSITELGRVKCDSMKKHGRD